MIDSSDMSRIVGEYIELNANILTVQYKSKFPKFIAKWIANRQRKKLLSTITKFRNSDYILTWANLVEYFSFLFNRFPPDGKYESVMRVRIDEMEYNKRIESAVIFGDYYAMLYFENVPEERIPENVKFNLVMKDKNPNDPSPSINIYLDRLQFRSMNGRSNMVRDLNDTLRNDICDFLEMMISPYMKGDTDEE